jgi:hypothetical protein
MLEQSEESKDFKIKFSIGVHAKTIYLLAD